MKGWPEWSITQNQFKFTLHKIWLSRIIIPKSVRYFLQTLGVQMEVVYITLTIEFHEAHQTLPRPGSLCKSSHVVPVRNSSLGIHDYFWQSSAEEGFELHIIFHHQNSLLLLFQHLESINVTHLHCIAMPLLLPSSRWCSGWGSIQPAPCASFCCWLQTHPTLYPDTLSLAHLPDSYHWDSCQPHNAMRGSSWIANTILTFHQWHWKWCSCIPFRPVGLSFLPSVLVVELDSPHKSVISIRIFITINKQLNDNCVIPEHLLHQVPEQHFLI